MHLPRPLVAGVAGALAIVAAVLGVRAWWGWLMRRRAHWFERLNDSIPINSDWWKAERAKPGELLYVAIGDSAAQGIGASRPGHSYVGQLAARLRRETGRTVRVVNLGVSGATVGLALRDQLPRLPKLRPDLLTVSIGANDVALWDAGRFEREYAQLVEALPSHAILADIPSFYMLPGQKAVREGNRIIRRLAAGRGLRVVDLHALTDRQGIWGMITQFAGDLFHPNDRGYRVWADAFAAEALTRCRQVLDERERAAGPGGGTPEAGGA
ncbi:SGNH/GDSL hydrolase family protein [Homoserinibacter sp. YIM 151385]|uniref:SGNH/GDSL hydrolase family protein n=1 Tax=Homoserinibacter sp. YIM 151385 TaxID=2985506 RepID=UPI0022F01103|nr:SGNH/GDSL hydrolase family protein [Homoserinibacter sp. YIM 151385]WBU37573.1 SGNH/GDSL hydrolase family protein [Homoserinibacter sp. YIM 151385]